MGAAFLFFAKTVSGPSKTGKSVSKTVSTQVKNRVGPTQVIHNKSDPTIFPVCADEKSMT